MPGGLNTVAAANMLGEIRRQFAPHPDDPAAIQRQCARCGQRHWQWKDEPKPLCPGCVADQVIDHNSSVSAKSGPGYEKIVRGQLRHWVAEALRLNLL